MLCVMSCHNYYCMTIIGAIYTLQILIASLRRTILTYKNHQLV